MPTILDGRVIYSGKRQAKTKRVGFEVHAPLSLASGPLRNLSRETGSVCSVEKVSILAFARERSDRSNLDNAQ